MKTPEELLNPRYLVIADFPQWSAFAHKKGDILELKGIHFVGNGTARSINEKEINSYPEIFSPLSWYAYRDVEDLLIYLKRKGGSKIYKARKYSADMYYVYNDASKYREGINLFIPATETEYQNYINTKK